MPGPLGAIALLAALSKLGDLFVEFIVKRAALTLGTLVVVSGLMVTLLGVCNSCLPAASSLVPPSLPGVATGIWLMNGGAFSTMIICVASIRIGITTFRFAKWVHSEANKA